MNNSTIINTKYLEEISNGDIALLEKIYVAYDIQSHEIFKNIDYSIKNQDYIQIARQYHTLKASFAVLGITKCVEDITIIENLTKKNSDINQINDLSKKINEISLQANQEFINFIENLKR